MRCYSCMKEIPEGSGRCPGCGYDLHQDAPEIYQLVPGTELHGRYTIGVVIGHGGFGVVYKAWDNTLERIVAIKEFFPTMFLVRLADRRQVEVFDKKNEEAFLHEKEDFLEEARNIARFNSHENIVNIFDFFEENGTAYFVMEYLDGKTIRDYISEAQSRGEVIKVRSAVHVAKKILQALIAAHKAGIIHRDIKPNNICITRKGDVKLFDFGAARFSEAEKEKTRTVIITPGYAPPEQYLIRSKQGPWTDIYAVGAVLYEMLTSKRPEESVNRKIEDKLEYPSELNTKIPKWLDRAIMRAMAVRPEIRFSSAAEFYKALEKEKKVRAAEKEVRRRKRRRNRLVAVILLAALCLVGFAGWRIWSDYRSVNLKEGTLRLWVPEINEDAGATEEMYRSMSTEFLQNNPGITLEITVIPENEYVKKVTTAVLAGEGPDIFDSTSLKGLNSAFLADIGMVYGDVNYEAEQCYLLDRYEAKIREEKRIPLLLDIPLLYKNAMTDDLPDSGEYSAFIEGNADFIGSTLDYSAVQEDMTGMFEVQCYEEEAGCFLNQWSINAASDKAQQRAGARLIHYFLSDNAQEILAIDKGLGLPVNKNIWEVYMEINGNLSFLTEEVQQKDFQY